MKNKTLTALEGVKVGHSSHPEKMTGCTVVISKRITPSLMLLMAGRQEPLRLKI